MSEEQQKPKGKHGGARPGAGRKPIQWTPELLKQIEELAGIGCTMDEIERITGIDKTTFYLQEGKKREAIFDAIERGRREVKVSLRRKQLAEALDGNPTMLVWLGKQLLGQRDKQEVKSEVTGANGGPVQFESPLDRLKDTIEGIANRVAGQGDQK